jgi:5-formyltetrahydrofolate cyclo-ligase
LPPQDEVPERDGLRPRKMLRNNTIDAAKSALRSAIRDSLNKMTPDERVAASEAACARLEEQVIWQKARSVLFYAPMPGEINVWRLFTDALRAGKTVLLPRYSLDEKAYVACHVVDAERDLRAGQFGIREPNESCEKISSNRLDLTLVPGIAFDLDGHRLGRGKGFYDQLLAALQGPTCGVAFDQQIVGSVPTEPHDMRLSCILTPTRWHFVNGPRAVLK